VGTTITPQLVDIVDTFTASRSYLSSGTNRRLRTCQVERWGLRTECPTPEDPFHDAEVTWLLPELNLRLTHQRPRSRHAKVGPSVLTAVRASSDGRYWKTTDLLLGLAAPGGTTARIVRCEEFAAAVAGRVLLGGDADLALCTVHKTLEELSRFRHDLSAWLAYKHIFDVWPPY
jgi:predicted RNA-binding protein associated with RNAse of E/G family